MTGSHVFTMMLRPDSVSSSFMEAAVAMKIAFVVAENARRPVREVSAKDEKNLHFSANIKHALVVPPLQQGFSKHPSI